MTHSRPSTIEVPAHLRSPGVKVPAQASAESQPVPRRPYRAAPSRRSRTQGHVDGIIVGNILTGSIEKKRLASPTNATLPYLLAVVSQRSWETDFRFCTLNHNRAVAFHVEADGVRTAALTPQGRERTEDKNGGRRSRCRRRRGSGSPMITGSSSAAALRAAIDIGVAQLDASLRVALPRWGPKTKGREEPAQCPISLNRGPSRHKCIAAARRLRCVWADVFGGHRHSLAVLVARDRASRLAAARPELEAQRLGVRFRHAANAHLIELTAIDFGLANGRPQSAKFGCKSRSQADRRSTRGWFRRGGCNL
jgi:hypothetical protein